MLRTVRPKYAVTIEQAASLVQSLPALAQTMVGLALLSGVRRGEWFALRWRNVDERERLMHIREAVYEGCLAPRRPKRAGGPFRCSTQHSSCFDGGGTSETD